VLLGPTLLAASGPHGAAHHRRQAPAT
jgi:hypothetical protein